MYATGIYVCTARDSCLRDAKVTQSETLKNFDVQTSVIGQLTCMLEGQSRPHHHDWWSLVNYAMHTALHTINIQCGLSEASRHPVELQPNPDLLQD